MTKPLLAALDLKSLPQPPVWIMRQAGRYLPEYRKVREHYSFQEAVSTPEIAAELTLQPIRRFDMDGAVIFADIMTPLEAMGVSMTFDPGPKLEPMSLTDVIDLPDLDAEQVDHVAETIRIVASETPEHTAVIGFAGAPVTLLAYLLEGGGSREFMKLRLTLRAEPELAEIALGKLARSMNTYLRMQIDAGAEVVQLFDTWAGLLDVDTYSTIAVPAVMTSLRDLGAPSIYFAPGAGHTLTAQIDIGARCHGVDWRIPLTDAFFYLEDRAVQGNLDPAILLGDPKTIRSAVAGLLQEAGGRPGHIMNLGHGIDRHTPPENVTAFVEAVRS